LDGHGRKQTRREAAFHLNSIALRQSLVALIVSSMDFVEAGETQKGGRFRAAFVETV